MTFGFFSQKSQETDSQTAQAPATQEVACAQEAGNAAAMAALCAGEEESSRLHESAGTLDGLVASIFFATSCDQLVGDDFAVLWDVVDLYEPVLEIAKDVTLLVTGYADARGSDEMNADLATRRADTVGGFLGEMLQDPALTVDPQGFGETEEESHALARRVDVAILGEWDENKRIERDRDRGLSAWDGMLDKGIALVREEGGGVARMRALRMMELMQQGDFDDRFIDQGGARKYCYDDLKHHDIEPEAFARSAKDRLLSYAASEDVEKFVKAVEGIGVAMTYGMEVANDIVTNEGMGLDSARALSEWFIARQKDPRSLYNAGLDE